MPRTPIYDVVHREGAELDYGFNWIERGWLAESPGDVMSAATAAWEISPSPGVTLYGPILDAVTGDTTTFVKDLVAGTDYLLTCTLTLASGRKDVRTLRIRCRA